MKKHAWVQDPLIWITLGLAILYLGIAAARPEGTFWSLDEGGKFLYVQNVIRTGNASAPLIYPGAAIDRELRFVPLLYYAQDGLQIYSWWPVHFPLLTLPLYRTFGWMGLYIVPALAGALCALCAGLLVRQSAPQPRWLAAVAAIVTGLATPIAFYSSMFWEHTLAAVCILAAIVATMWAWSKQKLGWVIAAGILASAGTIFRTELVGMAAGLGLVLLMRRWRWGIIFGGSYLIASLPWLIFNQEVMGNFLSRQWEPGSNSLGGPVFAGIQQVGKWFLSYLFLNAPRVVAFEFAPAILAAGTALILLALVAPWIRLLRPAALLAYAGIAVISGAVLFSQDGYRSVHGLVLVAPQTVFAAWLYAGSYRRSGKIFPSILLGAVAVFGIVFVVRAWAAAGGQQWGPRYLLAFFPLLVAAAVIGTRETWPQLGRGYRAGMLAFFILCTLIGFGFEVRGTHASLRTTTYYAETLKSLRRLGTSPITTDCTWLPMVMPEFYWQGNVFSVRGDEQMTAWRSDAAAAGVNTAHVVTLDICTLRRFDELAPGRIANPGGITVGTVQIEAAP